MNQIDNHINSNVIGNGAVNISIFTLILIVLNLISIHANKDINNIIITIYNWYKFTIYS